MQPLPKELLIEASGGDIGAFEKIYRATSDYVYTIALKVTGNRADAEEVAQDVFLKVFRKLGKFRFESSFTTWLYRITVNNAINASRKSTRRRSGQVEFNDNIEVADGRDRTREAIEKEQNEARVRSMLETLNPDQRACIVLREIEGMRYEEIAEVLQVNLNTVRSRLRRARETLCSRAQQERSIQ
ncbi:MAG: RNA polymerase sigma factor [Candidatus Aureabacteria bacterium]|nr:RNA polymerase sigma factor [Candidatus Auribacterota bacterium]